MAQKTDLNISPYYDDFDPSKNFYKVLFKPGFPVQARELTNLQSILQNQIEDFGSHMFKEGSIVIPGSPNYDGQFSSVKLNSTQFGVDISLYTDQLIGKVLEGKVSGVTASVDKVVLSDGNDVEDITIYVKYINAGISDPTRTTFIDGESLISSENIVYGNTTINAGVELVTLISADATSIGSAASVNDGVYFIRGTFVDVSQQTIILDHYTNTPSYRVGFQINEEIIRAKDDPSLYDNARGFTNYASPGADRLKIELILTKKLISDNKDTNFVEIMRIVDGEIRKIKSKTSYNLIRDYFAERTFDESGNYSVDPFDVNVANSLNNRLGNNGVFFKDETTDDGNTPSDDLMCIKASEGKAYVRGYDIQTDSVSIIDVEKPREVLKVPASNVDFDMGNILVLNNVFGQPQYRNDVHLHNEINIGGVSSSNIIGKARLYSLALKDSEYTNAATEWNMRMYDVQMYTTLRLNVATTNTHLGEGFFVKGDNSGATGYVVGNSGTSGGTNDINIQDVNGEFIKGESITINGGKAVSRSINDLVVYDVQDIKSVIQTSGGVSGYIRNFIANTALIEKRIQSVSRVTVTGGNTFTSPSGGSFAGNVKVGDVVSININSGSDPLFTKVTAINTIGNALTVGNVGYAVTGVFQGTGVTPPNETFAIRKVVAKFNSKNAHLYERLPNPNISSVDLTNSVLKVNAQITGQNVSSNSVTVSIADVDDGAGVAISTAFFESYDAERYSVHYGGNVNTSAADYKNSGIGSISSGAFTFPAGSGGSQVKINDLVSVSPSSVINVTAKKQGIQSKIKTFIKSQIREVTLSRNSASGTNTNSSNGDKLTYNSQAYGLRVQDEEISMNYPDVVRVLAVYESLTGDQPTFDTISLSATASVGSNVIIGENIVGQSSNAIARVVSNNGSSPSTGNANKLGIVYLNDKKFEEFEVVDFQESNITTTIEGINLSETEGQYQDITKSFKLNTGQKEEICDYSRLVRNDSAKIPSKRLMVVYDRYDVPAGDTGDAFTVMSYDKDRYTDDIPMIDGPKFKQKTRATDVLDFRPRVNPYNSTTLSPFSFEGRGSSFTTSPKFIVAAGESSLLGYEYYLGRIDKLYLTESGVWSVIQGESGINPQPPEPLNNAMHVATVELPPYLYDPDDAQITLVDNKRYTMKDIGVLEDRIEDLEEITTLSLLEVNTEALQVEDAQGNNRFKSGFFVDNFQDDKRIDMDFSTIQVDTNEGVLRPLIARNSLESQLLPAASTTVEDLDFNTDFKLFDDSVQKTGNMVTLKYKEVDYLEQPLATRVENVNPFHVISFNGMITLTPRTDSWVRSIRLDEKVTVIDKSKTNNRDGGWEWGNRDSTRTETSVRNTSSTKSKDIIVDSGDDSWMRSRNTKFSASGLRPLNRHYQFLDGNSDVMFIPKLLEITPEKNGSSYGSSGTFKVGETVKGYDNNNKEIINFRVAKSNHKKGSFKNPSKVYNINPYVPSENLQSSYTSSSKILNVDSTALAQKAQGKYSGYVTKTTRLVGQESGATAYVKRLVLISDNYGDLEGSFFLKDPNADPVPTVRVKTGTKEYRLNSSKTNKKPLKGSKDGSRAKARYTSTGSYIVRQKQTTITNLTTTTITTTRIRERENDDPLAQSFTVAGNIEAPGSTGPGNDHTGVFITSVDIFFGKKDPNNNPVTVEIRSMELGTPTRTVMGNSVTLTPDEITTSTTGEVATNCKFPEPIFLPPGKEYAIVLLAPASDQYEVWIARMGEKTKNTQSLPNASAVIYTQQWALGSLFLSQNGSIWTPSQLDDMKFKLYKAEFTKTSGNVYFVNPPLDTSNGYISKLNTDSLITLPQTGTIGISTIIFGDVKLAKVEIGRKLVGTTKDSVSAVVVGQGSSVGGTVISQGGIKYKAASAVETYAITGKGSGLKFDIAVTNGAVSGVTLASGERGNGYQVGDIVGIVTSSTGLGQGENAEITITADATGTGVDTLFVSRIQGTNATDSFGVGQLRYWNNSGAITNVSGESIRTALQTDGVPKTGKYIKINQFDHGMHASNNKVVISNASGNYESTKLIADASSSETSSISVGSTAQFDMFEGLKVSASNPGYIEIENEIIEYKVVAAGSAGAGTLQTLTRGVDSSLQISHPTTSTVEKYEMNGISLRRINTTHQIANHDIELDSYYVEINDATNGVDRSADSATAPQISFNDEGFYGGDDIEVTRNIQFESLTPNYGIITPSPLTATAARVRTVSGTSVGGNEVSFVDQGYKKVQINSINELETPRLVCSKVNETEFLDDIERNKSFTTAITFRTQSSDAGKNVSPYLYLDNAFTEFNTNRLNKPLDNSGYKNDPDLHSILYDPHTAMYVSDVVTLEKPANGLKVLLTASKTPESDFRVLYSLRNSGSTEINSEFILFPGWDNLKDTTGDGFGNQVKNPARNSGLSDAKIVSNGEFVEYQYTIDSTIDFTGYQIKIVMSGTNQAKVPKIKDIRTIALKW